MRSNSSVKPSEDAVIVALELLGITYWDQITQIMDKDRQKVI